MEVAGAISNKMLQTFPGHQLMPLFSCGSNFFFLIKCMTVSYRRKALVLRGAFEVKILSGLHAASCPLQDWICCVFFFKPPCFVLLQFALYLWIEYLSIAVFTGREHAITAPHSHTSREEGNKQLQLAHSTHSWVSILWRFALNDHVCPIFCCKNNSFLFLFHRKYVNSVTANHPTAPFCNRATIKRPLIYQRDYSARSFTDEYCCTVTP